MGGERMRRDGLTGARHLRVRVKIEDGVCKKCGCSTPGVHCFKFEVVLADLNDAEVLLPIMGADGIGSSLFHGKSAGEVSGMSRSELDDVIDKWTGVPIIAKFAISVDPDTDELKVFPYQMRRLPMSY